MSYINKKRQEEANRVLSRHIQGWIPTNRAENTADDHSEYFDEMGFPVPLTELIAELYPCWLKRAIET